MIGANPLVLVASSAHDVQAELFRLILECQVEARFASSVRGVLAVLSREPVSLVICGYALDDGTYRDVLRSLRRSGVQVPVVVASDPEPRAEFDHFLQALHYGAFDFLCFPYRWFELQDILKQAQREQEIGAQVGAAHESNPGNFLDSVNLA